MSLYGHPPPVDVLVAPQNVSTEPLCGGGTELLGKRELAAHRAARLLTSPTARWRLWATARRRPSVTDIAKSSDRCCRHPTPPVCGARLRPLAKEAATRQEMPAFWTDGRMGDKSVCVLEINVATEMEAPVAGKLSRNNFYLSFSLSRSCMPPKSWRDSVSVCFCVVSLSLPLHRHFKLLLNRVSQLHLRLVGVTIRS